MAEKGIILGRSSSQVSVYNYPEHLNPFYEEDQHKRLRFWKITKKSNGSRRSSLSLSDIKNWFPTLRKRSSTLGINKTSESPPPLRKSYNEEAKYNTFDPAMRHTFNSDLEDYFRRKTLNRSSLQASNRSDLMNESNFQRNSCSSSFHNYGYQSKESQPITSTPIKKERKKYSTGSLDIINVSSNPFETDDDIVRTATKRRSIKKRRAPLPPILANNVAEQSEESRPTDNSTEITENTDISKLAEEIEIFVKSTKADAEVQTVVQSIKKDNSENSTQKMDIQTEVKVKAIVESIERNISENSTPKTAIVQSSSNYNSNEQQVTNTLARDNNELTDNLVLTEKDNNQSENKIENVEKMEFQVTEQIQSEAIETKTYNETKSNIEKTVNTCDIKTRDFVEENKINDAKKSPEKILFSEQPAKEESHIDSITCNYSENMKLVEYKKPESATDNIVKSSKKSDENEIKLNNNQVLNSSNKKSNNTPKIINEKFHVLRIDESDFKPVIETKMEMKENTENELKIHETPSNFEANVESENASATKYPTKRLSIKEIIESINRSQSLLKFNQIPQSDECCNQQTSEIEKRQSYNNRKRIFQSEDIINNNNNIHNNKNYDEEQKNTISCKDTTTNLDVEQNSFIYNPIPKPRRKKDS